MLPSAVSQMMKRPIIIVRNGYKALLTTALISVKQYIVFRCLLPLSAKSLVQAILQDSFLQHSRIKPKRSICEERGIRGIKLKLCRNVNISFYKNDVFIAVIHVVVVLLFSGLTSLSTMFQSYHDGV